MKFTPHKAAAMIAARIAGIFDDEILQQFGPLSTDKQADVKAMAIAGGWCLIDTAPHDGTPIDVLYSNGELALLHWTSSIFYPHNGLTNASRTANDFAGEGWANEEDLPCDEPSFWMLTSS